MIILAKADEGFSSSDKYPFSASSVIGELLAAVHSSTSGLKLIFSDKQVLDYLSEFYQNPNKYGYTRLYIIGDDNFIRDLPGGKNHNGYGSHILAFEVKSISESGDIPDSYEAVLKAQIESVTITSQHLSLIQSYKRNITLEELGI